MLNAQGISGNLNSGIQKIQIHNLKFQIPDFKSPKPSYLTYLCRFKIKLLTILCFVHILAEN